MINTDFARLIPLTHRLWLLSETFHTKAGQRIQTGIKKLRKNHPKPHLQLKISQYVKIQPVCFASGSVATNHQAFSRCTSYFSAQHPNFNALVPPFVLCPYLQPMPLVFNTWKCISLKRQYVRINQFSNTTRVSTNCC